MNYVQNTKGGVEFFHILFTPTGRRKLVRNSVHSGVRCEGNSNAREKFSSHLRVHPFVILGVFVERATNSFYLALVSSPIKW